MSITSRTRKVPRWKAMSLPGVLQLGETTQDIPLIDQVPTFRCSIMLGGRLADPQTVDG